MKINAWGPINRFRLSEDAHLFDFLSVEATDSIIHHIYETLDGLEHDEQNIFVKVRSGLYKHGLGSILSPDWRYRVAEAVDKHYAAWVKDNIHLS